MSLFVIPIMSLPHAIQDDVGLFCTNPLCHQPSRKKFKNETGLMLHLNHFQGCMEWIISGGAKDSIPAQKSNRSKSIRSLVRNFVNPNYPFCQDISNPVSGNSESRLNQANDKSSIHIEKSANYDSVTDEGNNDRKDAIPFLNNNTEEEWEVFANTLSYSTDQKWSIALLKVLEDINAPDFAFGKILTWAREAANDNYSFNPPGGLSKRRHVEQLFNSIENAKRLLPAVCPVTVTEGEDACHSTAIICYDFVPQLLSILQNPDIMTEENLLINMADPLKPFRSPNNVRGEAISGSVYKDAYNRLITDPNNQLFVPIIQWIDRTNVTGNDRFSLKPYMFTPAIFKEKFRRTFPAWGFHGFLPKDHSSSAENKHKKEGENIRTYHAQLKEVLKTFISADSRLKGVKLPIGPKGVITCDIVTCILFIIQDIQEGDSLCGRYGPHTSNIKRHIRNCNCKYKSLDNPLVACTMLETKKMHDIAQSSNGALRKEWSQHRVDNAFNYVTFADSKHGIFGATPTEIMHVFRSGMIKVAVQLVLDNVPNGKKKTLDTMAKTFHKKHRQTIRKLYPATDFSHGVTNLSKISNAERYGLIFLFVILSNSDQGWDILDKALKKRTQTDLRKVLNLFEAMLCFDAWLHLPTFWPENQEEVGKVEARTSIQKLMKMCKARIPSENSEKWNFPKFHELLHIIEDISRFGSPINYCAERPESLLIPSAKQPGRRAQKRHDTYEQQAAQRLATSFMITTVYDKMFPAGATATDPEVIENKDDAVDKIEQGTGQATRATFSTIIDPDTNLMLYKLHWHTRCDVSKWFVPNELLDFMAKIDNKVEFCTEYCREGHIFRCHPNYQSNGPIYDWMTVLFEGNKIYPCRLVAVILCGNDAPEPYQLIIQCTTKKTGKSSVLLTEWYMSQDYYIVSPESIQAPCFVIESTDDDSKIHETLAFDKWAQEFTHLFEQSDI